VSWYPLVSGVSGHACAHAYGSNTGSYVYAKLPNRSIPTAEIALRRYVRYQSTSTLYVNLSLLGTDGSSLVTVSTTSATATVASEDMSAVFLRSGACAGTVQIRALSFPWDINLHELVYPYTPSDWSASGYETFETYPDRGACVVLPIDSGSVVKYGCGDSVLVGDRSQRLKLEARFSKLNEHDYQMILRYFMANTGQFDGFVRRVAVRHNLYALGDAPIPAYVVGHFSQPPDLVRNGRSNTWSGSIVIEEA
jgi:hypothetical protein